jgi:hypothetical protein
MKKQVISEPEERRTAASGINMFRQKSSPAEDEEYGA